jgi:hypothetical protein
MKPQYFDTQGMLIDGDFWQIHPHTGEAWTQQTVAAYIDRWVAPDTTPDIGELKTVKAGEIKSQAAERIAATDWKVQRGEQRVMAAKLGGEDQADALLTAEAGLLAVLNEREAIRENSSKAETKLMALKKRENIEQFSW